MTNNKYIVRNCPVNYGLYKEMCGICEKPEDVGVRCADCTDCVLKQVIEKCKEAISNYYNLEILRTACETSKAYGEANIAEQILQLFDTEEVRE